MVSKVWNVGWNLLIMALFLSTALQESAFIMQNRALAILGAYLLAYGGDDDFGGECDPMDGGNLGSLFAFFGWAHL